MIIRRLAQTVVICLAAAPAFADAKAIPQAVVIDSASDASDPAKMVAFQLPTDGAKINALLYLAAGKGQKPALLLLHGFPGNEQNLDLAQAARRAGWDVLTLHYRGSWGSDGSFSFLNCAQDAANAVRWLQSAAFVEQTGFAPSRIAVAGHSMGGMMAARTMADVPGLAGAFLIDPWDIAAEGRTLTNPAAENAFKLSLVDDLKPLDGTDAETLIAEMRAKAPMLDLQKSVADISDRPLGLIYAERGLGGDYARILEAADKRNVSAVLVATDHSFSDHRVQLATYLVQWLDRLK